MAIDIHSISATKTSKQKHQQIFEYWLDTQADINNLPLPGGNAANTSIAFIKATGQVYALGDNGWEAI